ncbi:MAG: cytidylate kinase-like family protein [Desulfobacterales bacterium]|nr:cytidylate kinase-like family protein [Candidatus Brocadiales bacterium]MBL6970738.1 cytidylate kinase-like family protein [Desulfobacterales bacterium]
MAVITISRQFGAGGRTLGEMIAKELDFQFLDDLIIQELADKAKVSTDFVKSMERTAGGKISKFISGLLSSNYIERLIGEDKGYLNEEIYAELLHEVILEFAKMDNVVLIGRGGQYILNDFEGAFHLLLVAEWQDRIKFMQQFYAISDVKAEKSVKQGETRRANLYKYFGKEDYDQPYLYHLVLNMSRLSLEQALREVVVLVQK